MIEKNIHIAIVEDDVEIRQTLSLIIDGTQGYVCKHTFADGESAIRELPNVYANVVLMDIDLPGVSGIQVVGKLKQKMPETDFLMLTVKSDDDSVFQSLCMGATGYLLKDTNPADLLKHIHEVHEGGSPMSSQTARKIIQSFRLEESPLSERETEVLKKLSEGMNYKTIAKDLFLSPHTIKTHIKNIYSKLHVSTRAEAIFKAINKKLI